MFNILLHVHNGRDWEEALLAVIPKRKGAVAKTPKAGDPNENTSLTQADNNQDNDCPSDDNDDDGSPSEENK